MRQKFIDLNVTYVLGDVPDEQLFEVSLVSLSAGLARLERGSSIHRHRVIYESQGRGEADSVPSSNTRDTGFPGDS